MTGGGTRPSQAGFDLVDHPGAQVLARPEAVPWVRYVLEGGETLHGAASRDRDAVPLPGRAPVWVIPQKANGQRTSSTTRPGARWAVRHFARGGRILPRLLGDRFLRLGVPRPFHETRVSEAARGRGLPTPSVVAAAVYQAGAFYRADLITRFVPDSETLAEALFDPRRKGVAGATERLDALRASGALIRALARGGLLHRDLNAGNVLLQWSGASPLAHVLDLDRSRVLPEQTPAAISPMLRRLTRSLRKWEGRTGLRLSSHEWEALETAAMG